ncbi:MAG: proline dehydrogenase family protein, partial [Gaiellales bacterium]
MASLKAGAEGALRAAILAAADSNVIAAVIRRYGMTLGARRFVAGEHIDECVQTLRGLNDAGFRVNTTLLGEGVTGANAAEAVTDEYVEILDRLASEELDASLAVKLTHLGLAIDEELARRNVERLARHARAHGISLRIDMEESEWVDATLRIFRRLLEEGHDHVGAVLQSYLYRSEADLESLLPLRPNLRIVKGAYLEPPEAAMPAKSDVDAAYLRLAERSLEDGGYTALATHDDRIIRHV